MPDLPPLVGHLKADTADWDSKMAVASAIGDELKGVLDRLADAADRQAISNEAMTVSLDELVFSSREMVDTQHAARDAALEEAAANRALIEELHGVRDAEVETAAATRVSSAARRDQGGGGGGLGGLVGGVGFMQVLIGAGVAMAAVLSPWIAFLTAGAGAVATLGLFAGGVGAIAAAMIALGVATGTTTQQVKDAHGHLQTVTVYTNEAARAWAGFTGELSQAAHTLGGEVAPIAAQFIGLLGQLVPIAVQLAQPIIAAFRDTMPIIMPFVKVLSVDLLRALQQVTLLAIDFFGSVAGRSDVFEQLFTLLSGIGIQAIAGLLNNLILLSDWFFKLLPAMGPQVGSFFSLLGTVVRGAISVVQAFTEWVVAHGPQIAAFFTQVGQAIHDGFSFVAPVIGLAQAALQRLSPVLQFVHDHASELKPVLLVIGGVLAFMAASFLLTVGSVILLAGAIVGLFLLGDKLVNWLKVAVPAGIKAAGEAFSWLGAHVHGFLGAIGEAIGGFFSGLGSRIHGGIAAVGAFFSGLGSAVHGALTAAWSGAQAIVRAGVTYVVGAVSNFVHMVVGFFAWLYDHNYYFRFLVDSIRLTFEKARDTAVAIWTAITTWLADRWAWVSGTAQAIWSAVTTWLSARWSWVAGVATAVWSAITGFIGARVNDARNVVVSVWNAVAGWLGGVWYQIAGTVGYWWGVVSSTISSRVHDAWNTITGVFGGLGGWFRDRTSEAWTWGYNLIQAIGKGIGAAAGAIAQAVRQIGGVIADWLGFHSPTRLGPGAEADMWAPNFIRMYAGGLTAGAGQVRAAAAQLAGAMAMPLGGAPGVNVRGAPAATAPGSWQINFYIYGATDPLATAAAVDRRLSRLLTAT